MHWVHISSVDLNLALVLHTLLEEKSVSRAARRLGLSQSATSHALARLRALVGDPLFVRTREGLVPTARTEAMRDAVATAIELLDRSLLAPPAFDPLTLRRTFHVASSDYVEHVLMRPLIHHLAKVAPNVDLWARPPPGDATTAVAQGDLDLLIQPTTTTGDRLDNLHMTPLWDDSFVGVMRRGHPLAKGPLTPERFAAARHAFIAPRGRPGGIVDETLAKLGLSRRVSFTTSNFLVAPAVVADTDLVITLAARIATSFVGTLPLVLFEPPLALDGFRVAMFWHERRHADPAHRFLREAILRTAKALPEPQRPRSRSPRRTRARAT